MGNQSASSSIAITRRTLIRGSASIAGAAALSAAGLQAFGTGSTRADDATPTAEHDEHAHWGYEGEDGPEHWSELDPDYAACSTGQEQSPIDLTDVAESDLVNIVVNYQPISPAPSLRRDFRRSDAATRRFQA